MEAVEQELPELLATIENYDADDVYNFDETSLFYRLEPDKTLATKRIEGRKQSKERVTIGLCSNATGTDKWCPIVIGKYAKPRCFKNVNLHNIGVSYRNNKSAWMTAIIFQEWAKQFDRLIRLANPDRKVLLLLDDCGSHVISGLKLKNTEIKFLPPNATSKLQPLDAGIIRSFKTKYRQNYVRYLLSELEKTLLVQPKLQLIDAIRYVVQSWNEVSAKTITHCWNRKKLVKLPEPDSQINEPTNRELCDDIGKLNLESPMTAEEYINIPE